MKIQNLPTLDAAVLEKLNDPIVSIPKLADEGYATIFLKDKAIVVKESELKVNTDVVALAKRDNGKNGLYRFTNEGPHNLHPDEVLLDQLISTDTDDESSEDELKLNYIPNVHTFFGTASFRSMKERVAFFHAALGYPTIKCMYEALKTGILELPGVTAKDVLQNPPKSDATVKGRLRQTPHSMQSTKPVSTTRDNIIGNEKFTQSDSDLARPLITNNDEAINNIADLDAARSKIPGLTAEKYSDNMLSDSTWYISRISRIASDAAGAMPIPSYKGHSGFWLSYIPRLNYIKLIPIKGKNDVGNALFQAILEAMRLGHDFIKESITDNEMSKATTNLLNVLGITVKKVATYNHRANEAERAWETAKAHIIAMLAGRHESCDLEFWSEITWQAEATLNMMRPGPGGISAFEAYWKKKYDFSEHPLAPWGAKALAYVPKALRTSWAYRAEELVYVGPSKGNYRSHFFIRKSTKTLIVRQQAVFTDNSVTIPKLNDNDVLRETILELAKLIEKKNYRPKVVSELNAWAESISTNEAEIDDSIHEAADGSIPNAVWVLDPEAKEYAKVPEVTEINVPVSSDDKQVENKNQNVIPELPTSEGAQGREIETLNLPMAAAKKKKTEPLIHIPTGAYNTRRATKIADALEEQVPEQEVQHETLDESEALPDSIVEDTKIMVITEIDHKKLTMKKAMNTPEADIWRQADATELKRLLEIKGVTALLTDERPYGVFARNMVKVLEHKSDKGRRVRAAYNGSPVKGDIREDQYNVFSSDCVTKKIFWAALATNSKKYGSKHCVFDIGSFYLHERNVLDRTDYAFYDCSYIPPDVYAEYASYIDNEDRLMIECKNAIYGMHDAGTIAGRVLSNTLKENGYEEIEASCLWKSNRPGEEAVLFNINVDDFNFQGIPNTGQRERLIQVLEKVGYKVSATEYDQDTQHYCGFTVKHDSNTHEVLVSLKGYVDEMLAEFNMSNCKPQVSPYVYQYPTYSKKQSPVIETDSEALNKEEVKELQKKIGKLTWYRTCIGDDIALALSKVASRQSNPTKEVLKACDHILKYLRGLSSDRTLVFRPSDMQLYAESDASFNSETKGRSRIGGIFHLGSYEDGKPNSSPIETLSKIADSVPDAASEAEYVGIHHVAKRGIYIRNILMQAGFKQKELIIHTDNAAAQGLSNDVIHDRKSKHIDRRYHWTRYEIKKKAIKVLWRKGETNLADFFTKYLPREHHEKYSKLFAYHKNK